MKERFLESPGNSAESLKINYCKILCLVNDSLLFNVYIKRCKYEKRAEILKKSIFIITRSSLNNAKPHLYLLSIGLHLTRQGQKLKTHETRLS